MFLYRSYLSCCNYLTRFSVVVVIVVVVGDVVVDVVVVVADKSRSGSDV